MVTDQKHLY